MAEKHWDIFFSWGDDKEQKIGYELVSEFYRFLSEEVFENTLNFFNSSVIPFGKWESLVNKALDTCQFGIFLFTEYALGREWVQHEYSTLCANTKRDFEDHENILCFKFPKDLSITHKIYRQEQIKVFEKQTLIAFCNQINSHFGNKIANIESKFEGLEWLFFKNNIKDILSSVEDYKRRKKQTKSFYESLKNELTKAKFAQETVFIQKRAELYREIEDLREKSRKKDNEIDKLKERVNNSSNVEALGLEIKMLQTEKDKLQDKISALTAQLTQKDKEIKQKDAEIATLNARIIDLETASKKQTQKSTSSLSSKYGNAVDLGLPSGTLWADRNIGADSPEDYGNYFAWGEIKPKNGEYTWDTYTYHGSPKKLPSSNDAATQNWDDSWCMPTRDQFDELIKNCKWTWKGKGYEVKGKNGNSIFLPAAGAKWPTLELGVEYGNYWSSSVHDANGAWRLNFGSVDAGVYYGYLRSYGLSVRAVRCKN